jgi:hypothetical protein
MNPQGLVGFAELWDHCANCWAALSPGREGRPPPLLPSQRAQCQARVPPPPPSSLCSHSLLALTLAIIFRRPMFNYGDSLSLLMTSPCLSSPDLGYLWLCGGICHLGPVKRHLLAREGTSACALGPDHPPDAKPLGRGHLEHFVPSCLLLSLCSFSKVRWTEWTCV